VKANLEKRVILKYLLSVRNWTRTGETEHCMPSKSSCRIYEDIITRARNSACQERPGKMS
jgi:hypothetical protein